MIFPTPADCPRPIRLKEATRLWAWESLHGKYGDEAMKTPFVSLDDIPGYEAMTDTEKYDAALRRIAQQAPLRMDPAEALCGAATLGDAISHRVPARYKGETCFPSVSHLTVGYDRVLREGMDALRRDIALRLADPALTPQQREFVVSLQNAANSMAIWHGRYLAAAKDARPDLYRVLQQVPFGPARTFREAVQALWFTFAFLRLGGNWPGIGRLDVLLGHYLKADLAKGTLTLEEAREILAAFFIKGCEWIQSHTPVGTGDAQHYQNIVLAGVDEQGNEVTNEVTYLALDVVEELGISDYPITLRFNRNTPPLLKRRAAEVMRHGGGVAAVYNEDLILQSLAKLGYPEEEARTFANDGCWEVQIPGKTDFMYMPFDALQLLNGVLGLTGEEGCDYQSIEAVYAAFRAALARQIDLLYRERISDMFVCRGGQWQAKKAPIPTSAVSLFEEGCLQNARSYYDFGPKYVVRSPHIGGAPDVANSLYAIEQLVFVQKKCTLSRLVSVLKANWEGEEQLRLYAKNSLTYYGNDSEGADSWHARVLNDFADIVYARAQGESCPALFIPGVSTFGRQIDWLPNRCATAFGYRKGDILSGNDSPVPGTDLSGATAIIRSCCKADLVRQASGAALDVKIFPHSLKGEAGLTALTALADGFLQLGGFFLQLDTVDTETLLEAQKDPQKFKTLSVRVSGWNARFVTLNREWQDMIIQRSAQTF